jgi:hypothetical protein
MPMLILRFVILSLLSESVSIQDDHGGTLCQITAVGQELDPVSEKHIAGRV